MNVISCFKNRLTVAEWTPEARHSLPDFLVISPAKTGSSWLAANLGCHPEICIPRVKEVRYFSSYYRWLDLRWYSKQFLEKDCRCKGEASPSYAILPLRMIRCIHRVMPRVKLIFLMRDPIGRAWSHARHNFCYREANFRGFPGDIDSVSDRDWRNNFSHPWPLAFGDYLGQLRRWLAVFPRQQFFVGSYEEIKTNPEQLLIRVFDFLGVKPKVNWSGFRVREVILPGISKSLPEHLERDLRGLLQRRCWQASAFLDEQFALNVAGLWAATLSEEPMTESAPPELLAQEPDDAFLNGLLQEVDSVSPLVVEERYCGFKVILHRGRFLAVPEALGKISVERLSGASAGGGGDILAANSLEGARRMIARHIVRTAWPQQPREHGTQTNAVLPLRRSLARVLPRLVGPVPAEGTGVAV
jgi:hypothetical protein